MAMYGADYRTGVARNGVIIATGWSPTLSNNVTGVPTATVFPTVQFGGQSQADDKLSKAVRGNSPGVRVLRDMLISKLTGNGNTIGTTHKQVKGVGSDNNVGGLRTIETTQVQSVRAFTTADNLAMLNIFKRVAYPATYVTDPSRNGGGGKVRW